jgi:2-polyprenyl-6-methoxyphenol hydroxylase-like FAD-dependent oxidoreductase
MCIFHIGDACHATLPNSGGQGANMAMEDSFVLAKCLTEHPDSHSAAFQAYQDIRLKRTHDIVKMGQQAASLEMAENPVIGWIRDQLFGYMFNSGRMVKMMAEEIVNKCPVPREKYFQFKN